MGPLLVAALFSGLLLVVCWLWPRIGRPFMGVFFLVMALGVNLPLVFVAPGLFVEIGGAAPLLGVYARFFATVVALAPALWGVLVVVFEAVVGLMILGRGRIVRLGLVGGMAFLLMITPLGVWTLANPLLALALLALWRAPRDRWAFSSVPAPGRGRRAPESGGA